MVTAVRRWGNSLAVRVPASVAEAVGLEEGRSVRVEVRDGRVVLTKVRRPAWRLADLLRRIRPENLHESIDTGAPRGAEVW